MSQWKLCWHSPIRLVVELLWYGKPEWTVSQSDGLPMSETSNLVHALEAAIMGRSSTDVIPDPDPTQFMGWIVRHYHCEHHHYEHRHIDIVTMNTISVDTATWISSLWTPPHGHRHHEHHHHGHRYMVTVTMRTSLWSRRHGHCDMDTMNIVTWIPSTYTPLRNHCVTLPSIVDVYDGGNLIQS